MAEGHQAPPIVNNGVMFVSTPQNQVLALDAKSGELLWRYKRDLPEDLFQLHPTNRGVGLYDDKVYLATLDAHVVALDAKTGKVVWDQTVEDYKKGYYMTLAPLVAKGKIMVGVSGGELGIRGFVQALDARTGSSAWKTFTIPAPGEPGIGHLEGRHVEHGRRVGLDHRAATIPQLNLTYWGTGNAAQWIGDQRPGDNLYSASVLALDVDTGKLRGLPPVPLERLVGLGRGVGADPDGRPARTAGRSRASCTRRGTDISGCSSGAPTPSPSSTPSPTSSRPCSRASTLAPGARPTTRRKKPVTGKKVAFCPSLWGGKDWVPAAYSPKTGYLYIPANENLCGSLLGAEQKYEPGKLWLGSEIKDIGLDRHGRHRHIGEIQAWDMNTGQKVWTRTFESHNWGPVLATGGGLVFAGGTNDRYFRAFDAKTGELAVAVAHQFRHHRRSELLRRGRRAVHRRPVGLGRRRAANAGVALDNVLAARRPTCRRAASSGSSP